MKSCLLLIVLVAVSFAGCSMHSGGAAEPGRPRPGREEIESAARSLEQENARLNRELQNVRLEAERLKERGVSLAGELDDLRRSEKELIRELESNERAQKAVEARLAETEKRLDEIISGREESRRELETISGDFSSGLRGLGLFTVQMSSSEVRVILPTVLAFTGGRVRIADGAEPILRGVAAVLQRHPGKNAVIEGHTDDVPISRGYSSNWELSFARALTVLEFLEREGVDPMRLSAAGYGKYRPRASNSTSAGRAENRRVEIVLRGD